MAGVDTSRAREECAGGPAKQGNVLGIVYARHRASSGGLMGAAYLSVTTASLNAFCRLMLPSSGISPGLGGGEQVILQLIERSNAHLVVVPARSSEHFIEGVKRAASRATVSRDGGEKTHNGDPELPSVRVLGSSAFDFNVAPGRLEEAGFPRESIGSALDLSDDLTLGACGAVLHIAQQSKLLGEQGLLNRVVQLNLDDWMGVDAQTLCGLDIIKAELHPSLASRAWGGKARGGGNKEGFSLLTLLDRTNSIPGKRLLRQWVMQPLAKQVLIEERLDAVGFCREQVIAKGGQKQSDLMEKLRGIRDVEGFLLRFRNRTASSNDWLGLAESLEGVEAVLEAAAAVIDDGLHKNNPVSNLPALLRPAAEHDLAVLRDVMRFLAWIDWDETKTMGAVIPADGVSVELDAARRSYLAIDDLLLEKQQQLLCEYGVDVIAKLDIQPVFIPVLGFLLQMSNSSSSSSSRECPQRKRDASGSVKGSVKGSASPLIPSDFQPYFTRNPREEEKQGLKEEQVLHYYRCPLTEQWNATHGDLYQQVCDCEQKVIRQVETVVVEREASVQAAVKECAQLDVLLSLARVAVDFEFCRPTFTNSEDSCRSIIKQGKHPLLMLSCEQYVPNDLFIYGGPNTRASSSLDQKEESEMDTNSCPTLRCSHVEHPHIILVTGPNFSGKSAYLKTVGVLHVMAQIGSYIPAISAQLSIIDRLFTRIESVESSSSLQESSFTLDTQQVANMLSNSTSRSLLLIDEFGKGTNSIDGASLLASTIISLSKRAWTPRTLIATHFLEIIDNKLLCTPHNNILCCEMRVLINSQPGFSSCESQSSENEDSADEFVPTALVTSASSVRPFFREEAVPVPLFVLRKGSCCSDPYAVACAKAAGIPKPVVRRARTVSILARNGLLPSHDSAHDTLIAGLLMHIADERKDWSRVSNTELREVINLLKELEPKVNEHLN